jgi:hypothetical protein
MTDQALLAEVAANLRETLLGVLRTFASPDAQREYQAAVPFVNLPDELFCQWGDDVYHPDAAVFQLAFTPTERQVLTKFHRAVEQARSELSDVLPRLEQFHVTPQAAKLAHAAAAVLARLTPDTAIEGEEEKGSS